MRPRKKVRKYIVQSTGKERVVDASPDIRYFRHTLKSSPIIIIRELDFISIDKVVGRSARDNRTTKVVLVKRCQQVLRADFNKPVTGNDSHANELEGYKDVAIRVLLTTKNCAGLDPMPSISRLALFLNGAFERWVLM